jgi:hypothetical protein
MAETVERQFDGLADLGEALGKTLNQPVEARGVCSPQAINDLASPIDVF